MTRKSWFIVVGLGCSLASAGLVARSGEERMYPGRKDAEPADGRQVSSVREDVGEPSRPPIPAPQGLPQYGISEDGKVVETHSTPRSPEPTKVNDRGRLEPLAQDRAEIRRRVSVRAWTAKNRLRILEPIRVRFLFENLSDWTMTLSPNHDHHRVFEIHARDSSGKEVAKTRYSRKLSASSSGSQPHELRPGEEGGIYTLVANLVYDLTEPGEYTLSVKVPFDTEEPFGELPLARRYWMAESEPIKVVVLPYDREIDGRGE